MRNQILSAVSLFGQIEIDGLPFFDKDPTADPAKTVWENGLKITFGTVAGIALLMVIINGLQYIVSRGDPQKTAQARQGLLYSAVGLLISLLALAIVSFVIKAVG